MRHWFTALVGLTSLAALALPALATAGGGLAYFDDGDRESLLAALAKDRTYLANRPDGATVRLGSRRVGVTRLRATARRFEEIVKTLWGTPAFDAAIDAEFEVMPMGARGPRAVRYTGYHLPLLEARDRPDATYRFPIYGVPKELVTLELPAFSRAWAGQRPIGRVDGDRVVPFYDRVAIDEGGVLAGRGLELGWVADELGRNGLMVQGSGLLRFANGTVVNVNYGAQNGKPYRSLGHFLIAGGKIPASQMSMPAIEAYFRAHPDELHPMINRNPSYVFFRTAPDGPYGSSGMSLVGGRAIATDKSRYGAGGIAYMRYPRARFDAAGMVAAWEAGGRFAIDADTGGAIVGADRVDIYWGGGEEAARRAGTLNGQGRLEYLLLKP